MLKLKNRKGISDVITTVLLIGITIVVVGVVWTVINGIVKGNIESSESCFGIFGKAEINSRYTCYKVLPKELQFSINLGDLEIDEMLVGISSPGMSTSFKLNNTLTTVANVKPYSGTELIKVKLPAKNAGVTYILNWGTAGFTEAPDSIEIVPIIGESQCEVIDSLNKIDVCS